MKYTLKRGAYVGIADTMGGELISCSDGGRELVWRGDAEHWSGHAPVLFPFVSALKNGKVAYPVAGGHVECAFAGKHGFARKSEFAVAEQTEDSITFTLDEKATTPDVYPYKFRLSVRHTLTGEGFATQYTVENTDSQEIVFCIGGHPGLNLGEGKTVGDFRLVFEKDEDCPFYYTDANSLMDDSYVYKKRLTGKVFEPECSDFDGDALLAVGLKSKSVRLENKADGSGYEFDFPGFGALVIWTPPKKNSPFVCLEPWNGLPAYVNETGNFEDKPFAITLAPGEKHTVGYEVKNIK